MNLNEPVEEKKMITNQILLNTIEGLKGISRIDFCVFDVEGKVLATTSDNGHNYEGKSLIIICKY